MRPFDEIESDIAAIAEEWSKGWALYYGYDGGAWLHQRKALLSELSLQIRAGYAASGEKVSEARLDQEAHAHPDYLEFLARHANAREAFALTDLRKQSLMAEMRRAESGVAA